MAVRSGRVEALLSVSITAKELAKAIQDSEKAAAVRAAVGPHDTRARMTSANARWQRNAEERDRKWAAFDSALEALDMTQIASATPELSDCEECGGPHVGMIHGVSPADSPQLSLLVRDLAERMDSVAGLLLEHGHENWCDEYMVHGQELKGAAEQAREWADAIASSEKTNANHANATGTQP